MDRRTPPIEITSNNQHTIKNCHVTFVSKNAKPEIVETITVAETHFTTVMTS